MTWIEEDPPVYVREPLSTSLRAFVWQMSDGRCWYCGKETRWGKDFHVDHIDPVSDGGTNRPLNLVPCCRRCNLTKGPMPLWDWRDTFAGKFDHPDDSVFWYESQDDLRTWRVIRCVDLDPLNPRNPAWARSS